MKEQDQCEIGSKSAEKINKKYNLCIQQEAFKGQ